MGCSFKQTSTHSKSFPGGSDGDESACNAGDPDSMPGWEDPLENGMATNFSIIVWRVNLKSLLKRQKAPYV